MSRGKLSAFIACLLAAILLVAGCGAPPQSDTTTEGASVEDQAKDSLERELYGQSFIGVRNITLHERKV